MPLPDKLIQPPEPPEPPEPEPPSPIEVRYAALGGPSGFLGAPTTAELTTPDGLGRYRQYQNGSIYWSLRTEAHEVHGLIRSKWAELGWERSYLGYPFTDELVSSDGNGRYNRFQHGMIYWTPASGAKALANTIQNVSLVKEQSKPEVYFICGDAKLWIPSPQEFNAVGFDWNNIQVVPDGALDSYRRHFFSAPVTIKPSDVFFDCGQDFDSITGRWRFNCKSSLSLVRKDVVVAGWLVEPPYVNNRDDDGNLTPHGVEDIYYNIKLDPDFIDRMYGKVGLNSALNGAMYPGNPPVPDNRMTFEDIGPEGNRSGVTLNSFILPGGSTILHGELNAWHVDNTGGVFTRHFVGRGPAPGGWRLISFENDANVWWPFDVMNPDAGSGRLQAGDYVIMKGALWQDGGHETQEQLDADPWHRGSTRGHEGWTEIHPVDWIVRVEGPKPAQRKTTRSVSEIAHENQPKPVYFEIMPDFQGRSNTKVYTVGEIRDLIDARATDIVALSNYSVVNNETHVVVQGTVNGSAANPGRFKATYIVGWRETDISDVVWVDDTLPAGAITDGYLEGWSWLNADPAPFSGNVAHHSGAFEGIHQHFFYGATNQLAVNAGDTLFAYVYLEATNIPYEVMLQWNDGSWEHRAYWGANVIDWGVDGTPGRRYMGPITTAGRWMRLEVAANLVGLEGRTLNGMAFTLFGGRATWDRAGKCSPPPPAGQLHVSVQPWRTPLAKPMQITIFARDAISGNLVANANVHIRNFSANGILEVSEEHDANTPFSITWHRQRVFDPETGSWFNGDYPSGTVSASGYPEVDIEFRF